MPLISIKQTFKITAYSIGGLILLLLLANWFFIANARYIIKQVIENETHGKVQVNLGRVSIHYFDPPSIDASDIRLGLMDSTGAHETYLIKVKRLRLQLRSLSSLFYQKKLLVDQIIAESPSVEVFPQYQKKKKEGNGAIVFELGNIYKILDTLSQKLEVKDIRINKGSFGIDQYQPGNHPARINDIYFHLDNFHAPKEGSQDSTQFMYSDDISLNSGRLVLMFPDGRHGLSYTSLDISTRSRTVTIDSCNFFSTAKDSAFNAIDLKFDQLRLVQFDFNALYHAEKIKVDTVFCLNPNVDLKLDLTRKQSPSNETDRLGFHSSESRKIAFQKKHGTRDEYAPVNELSKMLGNLDVGYIALKNSRIALTTKNGSKVTPFTTNGNNFEVGGLRTGLDGEQPISVQKVAFAIKNYRAFSADSLYQVLFDSVVYDNKNLFLKNFVLEPSEINQEKAIKRISIPVFELKNLSLNDLIGNQKLKADELLLIDPKTINYHSILNRPQRNKSKPLVSIIEELNKKIAIDKVSVQNGRFLSQSLDDAKQKVEADGIFTSIDAKELLHTTDYALMGHAIGNLSFENAIVSSSKNAFRFEKGQVLGRDQVVNAEKIYVHSEDSSLSATLYHTRIEGYDVQNNFQAISLGSISWQSAEINVKNKKSREEKNKKSKMPELHLQAFNIHDTRLNLDLGNLQVITLVDSMSIHDINKLEGSIPSFSDLRIALQQLHISMPGTRINAEKMNIHDGQASWIKNVDLVYEKEGDSATLIIPTVSMTPFLEKSILGKKLYLQNMALEHPKIRAHLTGQGPAMDTSTVRKNRAAEIGKFSIHDGDIGIETNKKGKHLDIRSTGFNISLKDLHAESQSRSLTVGTFSESLRTFRLNSNDSLFLETEEGGIELSGNKIMLNGGDGDKASSLQLEKASISGLHAAFQSPKRSRPLEVRNLELGVAHLELDSLVKKHIARRLKSNPNLYVRNIDFKDQNDLHDIAAYGIRYENHDHLLALDSFHYRPAMDRDSFNRMQTFQKDYMQTRTGQVAIRGIDIEKLISDSIFHAEKILVSRPIVEIYKDKRLPFQHGIIKNLPTDLLLNKVPKGIMIDSLKLDEMDLKYEEFNDKTQAIAEIRLDQIEALVTNIRNREMNGTDSLRLIAYGKFMDTTDFRFHFRESYADSLHGFLMSLRASPTDLRAYNSYLLPLASARIISGYMDTLRMRAVGREHLAYGYMQMLYHDLKIQYLNKGDVLNKTFVTKLVTFFANNIILRRNNKKRTGVIYFERIRDRSFVNYWIKILISGVLTNAGVKENTKQEKKYKRGLKKMNVPELPEVVF